MLPSGRLTTPNELTSAPSAPLVGALTGCHACRHAAVVQMKLPARSPLSRYSVKPAESVSTVAPGVVLAAVLTTAPEAPEAATGCAPVAAAVLDLFEDPAL
jgi:hypothetical protein